MFDVASVPDLLRLLVIPFFGYVAWRDVKTRRVPNRLWLPLAALAVVLFIWETWTIVNGDVTQLERQRYYIQATMSVGFLVPLSYLFWRVGGFGGADAKAFFIIAVLFPTYPVYQVDALADVIAVLPGAGPPEGTLPVVVTTIGVFSITILSNTVLVGVLYPVVLAGKNAASGYVSPGMFVAKPVRWDETTAEYGTLLEFSDRGLTDDLTLSGLREYFTWRGLDLDALRMYLQWRGATLDELRENPEDFRDPASLPSDPNPPGDGAIRPGDALVTDGGRENDDPRADGVETEAEAEAESETEAENADSDDQADPDPDAEPSGEDLAAAVGAEREGVEAPGGDDDDEGEEEDPWGAEAFLEDIEGSAYGTTPETLRDGLESLTSDDVVWISPGIPFLVPLFVGLVVAYTYGDLLFAILDALGMAQ